MRSAGVLVDKKNLDPQCYAAYSAGHDAYIRGIPVTRCPFSNGSIYKHWWRDGWLAAQGKESE